MMELIQRTVNLEDLISRKSPLNLNGISTSLGGNGCVVVQTKDIILQNAIDIDFNWGQIVAESFSINIFLKQNIDDIGIFLDADYVDSPPNYDVLENYYDNYLTGLTWTAPLDHDLVFTGPYTFDQSLLYRLRGQSVSDYYFNGEYITGLTDSTLNSVKSYNILNPYQIGLNLDTDPTQYFTGVLSLNNNSITYVIDALISDLNNSGIKYTDDNTKRTVYDDIFKIDRIIDTTIFSYTGSGWNYSNISLSAITKEELDLGVVFPHEIKNEVFIDRGVVSAKESQMRLSEIDTLEQLERYGNKFYNIKKQY
jgi:hypothetical protein